jgi:hypothetical protein
MTNSKPLPSHHYHGKSDIQLQFIAQDSGKTARCNARTILAWRQQRDAFLAARQGRHLAAA